MNHICILPNAHSLSASGLPPLQLPFPRHRTRSRTTPWAASAIASTPRSSHRAERSRRGKWSARCRATGRLAGCRQWGGWSEFVVSFCLSILFHAVVVVVGGGCWLFFVVCCLLFVVCCMLFVVCCLLLLLLWWWWWWGGGGGVPGLTLMLCTGPNSTKKRVEIHCLVT